MTSIMTAMTTGRTGAMISKFRYAVFDILDKLDYFCTAHLATWMVLEKGIVDPLLHPHRYHATRCGYCFKCETGSKSQADSKLKG